MIMGSSLVVDQTEETRAALHDKFGIQTLDTYLRDSWIVGSSAELTNSQARYLLSFKDLASLDNRIAAYRHPELSTIQLNLAFA
jgi:hypothetical protein